MYEKSRKLKALLNHSKSILAVGAHDAMSAKLIEEAGFDAIWAGGFGISAAQKCLPDANYMTMTENLEIAQNIDRASSLPVIADCDNGYGNAVNVMRTVSEYEAAGIAGICIEDNIFPKRCSFYPGFQRELVPVEEMQGRIRAGKSTQRNPDFLLIARTEALIAGWGMEEALKRGRAFAEAGADAVLIHSKSKSADEVKEFARRWDQKIPLVVVPTIFDDTPAQELEKAGFKIIIFANHPIRASIKAMRETLQDLKTGGCAKSIRDKIVSLEQVYELVGVDQLKEAEDQFLPVGGEKIKAIIVSAGFEKHLLPLIEDKPKSMLDIKGKTILERQIEVLNSCNIKDIVVVRGYKAEAVQLPNVRYYENTRYKESYILSSFFCAQSEIKDRVILLYGDVLFDRSLLEKLLQSPADISILVDQAWRDAHSQDQIPQGLEQELVIMKEPPQTTYRYIPMGANHAILKIGQNLDRTHVHGEFIGIAMLSPKGSEIFCSEYERLNQLNPKPFHESPTLAMASLTDMIQELIDQGHPVKAVDTYKGWMEIDTFEDYQHAWAHIK